VRVLFVSHQPPLPTDSGARLRTFHLLEELSARCSVRLVTYDRQPGSPLEPVSGAALEAALPRIERVGVVPAPAFDRRRRQLRALLTRHSYAALMIASDALTERVRVELDDFEPDLVHCDSLFLGFLRGAAAGDDASWVLALHNSESLLMKRLAGTSNERSRALLYRSEAAALERLEQGHAARFDHCTCVTDDEAELFRRHNPSTVTVPNGVGPRAEPAPPTRPAEGEPLRLLFVGTQSYEPNRQGLAWFAREVMPLLRERVPLAVDVVGPGQRGAALSGVNHLGRVEDLTPCYERSHVVVVPLLAGGGSRLKVLEALAHGVPLVSTSIGVEGFDLVDGEHALIADDPRGLADRLVDLDRDLRGEGTLAAHVQHAGYRYATAFFWPRIGELLFDTYREWTTG
jgi:glycosyltransferase involved in cell wall biosynthesis